VRTSLCGVHNQPLSALHLSIVQFVRRRILQFLKSHW
jgi:hypothetical protein